MASMSAMDTLSIRDYLVKSYLDSLARRQGRIRSIEPLLPPSFLRVCAIMNGLPVLSHTQRHLIQIAAPGQATGASPQTGIVAWGLNTVSALLPEYSADSITNMLSFMHKSGVDILNMLLNRLDPHNILKRVKSGERYPVPEQAILEDWMVDFSPSFSAPMKFPMERDSYTLRRSCVRHDQTWLGAYAPDRIGNGKAQMDLKTRERDSDDGSKDDANNSRKAPSSTRRAAPHSGVPSTTIAPTRIRVIYGLDNSDEHGHF
nr:hypothetical protein Iba_chr15dCG0630 [Ipomoea batatas]